MRVRAMAPDPIWRDTMTKYTAEFADRTITRNSDRQYSHAWLVTDADGGEYAKGFSARADLAASAARASLPQHISPRDKSMARLVAHHRKLARDAGFNDVRDWYADCAARTDKKRASLKIEIVEVAFA